MTSKRSAGLFAILALTLLACCGLGAKPTLQSEGGVRLVLLVEPLVEGWQVTDSQLEAAIDIINDRAKDLGADNPTVQLQEGNRIVAELPGVTDVEKASNVMAPGLLELVAGGDTPPPVRSLIITSSGAPSLDQLQGGKPTANPAKVWEVIIRGDEIDGSTVKIETDEAGLPRVVFRLKGGGPRQPEEFTPAQVARYVAIVLDKEVISVPMILTPMTGGEVVLTGLTNEEATRLAAVLRSGVLPVVLRVVESEQVAPTER